MWRCCGIGLLSYALLAGTAAPARAGLMYANGLPDQASGNEMTRWVQTEDFSVGSGTTLTDVRFWAFHGAKSFNGSIFWQIFADDGGQPGAVVKAGTTTAVTETPTGRVLFGLPEYEVDFSVGSVKLPTGTYWLGLHNGPSDQTLRAEYYWETTPGNSTSQGLESLNAFSEGGYNNGYQHAFELYDVLRLANAETTATNPEPASVTLLGTGLASLLGYGWKRRRNAGV
jgi:hypothetical protein